MSLQDSVRQVQVSNGQIPTVSQVFSFQEILVLNASVSIDLKSLANLHRINNIQGIFLDNSNGSTALTCLANQTGQNIIIPAGYQGVMPFYLSADNVITLSGDGTVKIVLVNFPTPASVWPTATQSLPIINNLLQVSDPALEALIQNGGLNINDGLLGTGDIRQSARGGVPFSGIISAATTVTIITGAPSSFISAINVRLRNDSTITAGGLLTVTLAFSTLGTIFARTINFAAATAFGDYTFFNLSGLNLSGNLTGDNVTLTLSAALATGSVQYSIIGGTTAIQ